MQTTRIAVAGAGYIGQAHITVLQSSSTVSLCAVVDPSPAAQAIAASAGVAWFASLDDLLAVQRPDGIVLATPNALHESHALQCITARVPILLEKPIAPTVKEAEHIVALSEKKGTPVLIGHHRAHSPIMAKACEVVHGGQLGRIVAVQGSAMFYKPDEYFVQAAWRRELGAGPILLNMIHEVHNLRMLCGEIEAVQAFKSHAVRGFAVEDTVAITLQFVSGTLGTFMLSDTAASAKSWEQTSQENKAYPSYSDEDCYCVSGTKGSLAVPTMRLKTYASDADRSWWKPFEVSQASVALDDPIKLQMAHFGAVVRGECAPLVSARDGLQNLRVTEAIVKAAQMGSTVKL
ncbi:MAG: gfo/Idh/MocA family oxidoreductase [Burkholderiales bacterium]|nr:MAG: gfo/Idh/MocA family oxidoreductase [Burkholderiales bacterium]